jgi:hypothetical protein
MMRLAGFIAVGLGVTSLLAARQARAQVHEGMRRLARQIMPYAEQGVMEAPRRVEINGESVYLSMGTAHDNVSAVLDYYQRWCEQRSGHVADVVRAQSPEGIRQVWEHANFAGRSFETWRSGDDHEGYVACVDVGEGQRLSGSEFTRRIQAVVNTGDLSNWGNLRYAYVTRGTTGTRILTVATDGKFQVLTMFPTEGDAPGSDAPGLARYPGMRRVLSAHEDTQPNSLGMYTVRAPIGDVKSWYGQEMARRGWTPAAIPNDRRLPADVIASGQRALTFARGNDAMMVLVFDHTEGVTSMMSLQAM